MREIVRHVVVTLRSFARQPGMVLVVVLTLALGIGASTALFAYLAAILWPTLDAPEPERVVWVHVGTPEEPYLSASYLDYRDLQSGQSAVRDLVGSSPFGASVRYGKVSAFAWGQAVTGSYLSFFSARPELGRLLQPADDQPGAEPVLVAGHGFWQGTLGGDPEAIGRPLRLNGETFTLVGVLPKSFRGPGHTSTLYLPMAQYDRATGLARLPSRDTRLVQLLGRLAPGVTLETARQVLQRTASGLDEAAPLASGKRRMTASLATVFEPMGDDEAYFNAARVLMAAALLFLLLTCANVANLLLARATARQREWGIRASLGASRRRLVGSVLSESLILCLAGGVLGLGFAALMARRLDAYILTAPAGLGSWSEGDALVRLDFRVFAFALAVALLSGLLCGLAPVLRVIRGDLVAAIKSDAAGAAGPPGALVSRKLLVILQVSFAVLLLLVGSLLVRTLRNAEQVALGFEPGRILLASLYVPRNVGSAEEGATEVYRRVLEEAAALPGVKAASLAYGVPLARWDYTSLVTIPEKPDKQVETASNRVAPGYFDTLDIPLLQGRAFDPRDRRDSPPVVIVNQALANRLWGKENPIGRLISIPDPPAKAGEPGPLFEVVGVTADVRVSAVTEPPGPSLYIPATQRAHSRLTLILRTASTPASLVPALRRAVQAAHPDLTIVDLVTGDEQLRRSLSQQRMHAEIAGLFGLLGFGVSVVGLFGLLSYTVSQRVREFGIRMAIGAQPANVERLVLRQGMGLVAVGLALGLAGALGVTRLLDSLLYGVAANDPVTFVGVSLALTAVTLLACYLPAHRASRLDPLDALRGG